MKLIKNIIYHLLLAFRGIFFMIFNLLSILLGLCILGGIFAYFVGHKHIGILLGPSLFYIAIYFLKHFYDKIIFWAKPDDIELTLYK